MTNTEKILEFSLAVRGYHHYRIIFPQESEVLDCYHDFGNTFDMFTIKTSTSNGQFVEYLSKEISIVTKFLLDGGAVVHVILSTTISNPFALRPGRIGDCM